MAKLYGPWSTIDQIAEGGQAHILSVRRKGDNEIEEWKK